MKVLLLSIVPIAAFVLLAVVFLVVIFVLVG